MSTGDSAPERILLTGVTSIHGWPLFTALRERYGKEAVVGVRPPESQEPGGSQVHALCVTDRLALEKLRARFRPDCLVHAGGVCDLDVCEERPAWAEALNVDGARAVVEVFGETSRVIYLSTDLVYSGARPPAGGYREEDTPDPVSVVGNTYRLAEEAIRRATRHLVLRLGLPMGASIQGNKGAVDWIKSRLQRELPVTLFHDEWRSCIDTEEIARVLLRLLETPLEGLYHLGGPDKTSLHEIGQQVLARGGHAASLLKTCSRLEEVGGPPRIGNVHLNSSRLAAALGTRIRPCRWHGQPQVVPID
jgi:dTDP-4-dehydrorhamnose reductase